jgi:drug/metabolite transporter (DMT)-like permease
VTESAIGLILVAAFAHATWNFLAKKASGGAAFIWLFAAISTLIYFPLALWIFFAEAPLLGYPQLGFIAISSVLHSLYYILLDKGYRTGDLSLIYPLARGTGPMLSTIGAIIFLDEAPSTVALCGTLLIGLGIVIIAGNPLTLTKSIARKSIALSLLCGAMIAGYTLSDKLAVTSFLIPPLLLDWSTNLGRLLLLTPYALKNWNHVKSQWNSHKLEAISVAILCPLAYILVLSAMVFSPVSYIAPAREISILIGTAMGARLLSEGHIRIRCIGAIAILIGLGALSIG